MHTQDMMKFYQFVLKILSGNEIMTVGMTELQTNQIQYSPPPFSKLTDGQVNGQTDRTA